MTEELHKENVFRNSSRVEHYLIREIKEQPLLIEDTLRLRYFDHNKIHFEELNITEDEIKDLEKICIVAHGSSYNAALIFKYLMEVMTNLHIDVLYSSDFTSYYKEKSLLIGISQSGETSDTINAIRSAIFQNIKTMAITNVGSSTLASIVRDHNVIDIKAKQENAISATKSYTLTLLNLILFTLHIGLIRGSLDLSQFNKYMEHLQKLPGLADDLIDSRDLVHELSYKINKYDHFLFLGRGRVDYPTALEGALKLKETAYMHGEGLNDAALKHGPIAMIDERFVTISIATNQETYSKVISNIRKTSENNAFTVAILNNNDTRADDVCRHIIYVPEVPEILSPIINVIPFQLLAYYMGYQKGLPVDKPRNLVKSVLEPTS